MLRVTRRLFRQLTSKNYYAAKAYHLLNLYVTNLRRPQLLLVFQMGKVGSASVVGSLKDSGLDMPIYHIHFLSKGLLARNENLLRDRSWSDNVGMWRRLWTCQFLRRQLDRGLKGKRWKIVTLTREPVGRNISAFFQSLEVAPQNAALDRQKIEFRVRSTYRFEVTITAEHIEDLVDQFFAKFDHDTPLVYFDRELKEIFGVDVYKDEFPKAKGYKIYAGKNVDVLLIRLESLASCARDAFREYLGIKEFRLDRKNIGTDKSYAFLYREFRKRIILPDVYLDEMYNSRYARHFYGDDEIAAFRARWTPRRESTTVTTGRIETQARRFQ